jgi:hypothetical protein
MADIEKYRLHEINQLSAKIKEYTNSISRMENTNHGITRSGIMDSSYINNFKEKNFQKMEEYRTLIKEYEKKISDIHKGLYDSDILKDRKDNSHKIKTSAEAATKKRTQEEKKKKDLEQKYRNNQYSEHRKNKDNEYFMRKELEYFYKTVDSIPDNLYNKLKNMPNNKGYIWRDVWFMGELPPEEGEDTMMFEKKERDVMRIHVITSTHYLIYEKYQNYSKKLIYQRERRKKKYF